MRKFSFVDGAIAGEVDLDESFLKLGRQERIAYLSANLGIKLSNNAEVKEFEEPAIEEKVDNKADLVGVFNKLIVEFKKEYNISEDENQALWPYKLKYAEEVLNSDKPSDTAIEMIAILLPRSVKGTKENLKKKANSIIENHKKIIPSLFRLESALKYMNQYTGTSVTELEKELHSILYD